MLEADDETRVEHLLSQLTLAEKVSMAAGSGMWFSTGVPRLGIPAYKLSDGPNGVRGEARSSSVRSAAFPVGVCLAATWDRDLVASVGDALADECETKDVQVLLGPTINLQRTPLAGRNFECYSEDPFLTGEIAVALIRAVQQRGIACCAKHFVCNDSEFQRQTLSSEVSTRALREVYLAPFERAVKDAGVWSVMAAYNRVNGVAASAHDELLSGVLKGEWGFDGVVVSDWGGTYDTVGPALAGLDLEMPGPARHMGAKLLSAVERGHVPEALIDDKVRRHLRLLLRTGRLDRPEPRAERSMDDPRHRALIRRVAADGMVLLKNDSALPLRDVRRLALIGPNAVKPQILGGGSSMVLTHPVVSPIEGLTAALPDARIEQLAGCHNHRYLPLLPQSALRVPGSDRAGFELHMFAGPDFGGDPVRVTHPRRSELVWFGFDPVLGDDFSVRAETLFTPAETGVHRFGVVSAGRARLLVDGVLVVDNWARQRRGDAFFGAGSAEETGAVELESGKPVQLTMEFCRAGIAGAAAGVRLGMAPPSLVDDVEGARRLAASADAAVVIVGLDPDWESEGHDRPDLELPGAQTELIREVAAVNRRTIVVLNCGSALRVADWVDEVAAVVHCWYPGEEFGNALADVLCGRVNPSGRLPFTMPRRLEDNPTFLDYPGERDQVRYGEGVFVGYRYYDKRKLACEFPFGHGLSYTQFAYAGLRLDRGRDGGVIVELELTNTGARAGSEVAQVYVSHLDAAVTCPTKALAGFAKVHLDPGETRRVVVPVAPRAFCFYDVRVNGWAFEPGRFRISLGASSRDLRLAAEFELSTLEANSAVVAGSDHHAH